MHRHFAAWISTSAWGSAEAVLQPMRKIRSVKGDLLNHADDHHRQHRPKNRKATRPPRNQQQPAIDRREPESVQDEHVVELHRPHFAQWEIRPEHIEALTAA